MRFVRREHVEKTSYKVVLFNYYCYYLRQLLCLIIYIYIYIRFISNEKRRRGFHFKFNIKFLHLFLQCLCSLLIVLFSTILRPLIYIFILSYPTDFSKIRETHDAQRDGISGVEKEKKTIQPKKTKTNDEVKNEVVTRYRPTLRFKYWFCSRSLYAVTRDSRD